MFTLPGHLETLLGWGASVGTLFTNYHPDEHYFGILPSKNPYEDHPYQVFSWKAAGSLLAATEHGELHWLHPCLLGIVEEFSCKTPQGVTPEESGAVREFTRMKIEKMKVRQNAAECAMKEIRDRRSDLTIDAAFRLIESLADKIGCDSTAIWQIASIAIDLRRETPCSRMPWEAPLMIKAEVLRSFTNLDTTPPPSLAEVRNAQIWLSHDPFDRFDEVYSEIEAQIIILARAETTSTSRITYKDRLVLCLTHNLEGLGTREQIMKEIADCFCRDADWSNFDLIEVIGAANDYMRHHAIAGPSVALAEVNKQAAIENPYLWIS